MDCISPQAYKVLIRYQFIIAVMLARKTTGKEERPLFILPQAAIS